MQVHLALIYCGVCELLCIESNTKELRQICDNYKCLDGNFAANLKRDGYFSIEKGINSEIALTMPGRDALRDYIKELMNTEGKKEQMDINEFCIKNELSNKKELDKEIGRAHV